MSTFSLVDGLEPVRVTLRVTSIRTMEAMDGPRTHTTNRTSDAVDRDSSASAGGADYYLDKVANSVDDYYLGRGEAPGQWIGATAAAARADRPGRPGGTPEPARRHVGRRGGPRASRLPPDRRPGYDLTFSAPKGVSLLWAFGPADVRDAISVAHDRAVAAVSITSPPRPAYARRGAGGHQLVEANGFIGAAFRHRTSRAGDPQLHTHVVVPNLVQGADGRWSAPDGRHLYAWKKTAGTLYQSALRAELAPLGLAWQRPAQRPGRAGRHPEDDPPGLLQAPGRHRGGDGRAGIDVASERPRRPPSPPGSASRADVASLDVLREGWAEQLAEHRAPRRQRVAPGRPLSTTSPPPSAAKPAAAPGSRATSRRSSGSSPARTGCRSTTGRSTSRSRRLRRPGTRALPVTLLGSTFTRRDAISAVARAFDVTPDEAVALTASSSSGTAWSGCSADPAETAGTEHIRTRSGHVVPATSGDRRYTTTELLAAEERIVDSATARSVERTGTGRPGPRRPGPRTPRPPGRRTGRRASGSSSPRATATTW